MMKQVLFALLTAIVLVSCFRVPITNRKQMRLFPESQMIAMADTAYREFLSTAKVLPKSDPRSVRVERVGQKIAASISTFLKKQNASERIEGFSWEFNTVDDPTVNAWCMPGGKVVVYTGILPLAADDSSLAVVMGHEIAHAVARHGNERMSQAFAVQGLGQTLGGVMADPAKRNIFLQSYGVASTLGMLKYSRNHESEADKMGLVFMYLAGFNPAKAIDFWEKMSKTGGQAPPELLSTHPSDETRIADIKSFLPEIKKYAE